MLDKTLTKNQKKAETIIYHFQSNCADAGIDSIGYGEPQLKLGIGMYEMLISSKSYIDNFTNIHFIFFPKVSYIPNPNTVLEWIKTLNTTEIEGVFISPTSYRWTCLYEGTKVSFDVIYK